MAMRDIDWTASSRMPFGKHRDQLLAEIPEGYKKWLAEQDFVNEKWPNLLHALQNIKQINKKDIGWSEDSEFPIGKNAGTPLGHLSANSLKWYTEQKWFRDTWPNLTQYILGDEEGHWDDCN